METEEKKILVTEIQNKKGLDYLAGKIKDKDFYILAQTYVNEILSLVGRDRFWSDTDKNIFNDFCKAMETKPEQK